MRFFHPSAFILLPSFAMSIEIISPIKTTRIRSALFDFDGTISLIREGWQGVMIPMMVRLLLRTPRHESEAELTSLVGDFVAQLTGKQTIYQMIRLAEEIEKRGGTPEDPLAYKKMYLALLWERISERVAALKEKSVAAETMMVPGASDILRALQQRNIPCYLASGTDEPYVLDEAAALGVTSYFAGIYGAQDNYKQFSKRMVIERIIAEHTLQPGEFVAFGDGYVEIEEAKAVGGAAVGVASNEATRSGIDAWKRKRLIAAGADIITPDFRDNQALLKTLGL